MSNVIGYLPRLYDGELLYSLFARYHAHSLNESPKQTMLELFGNQNHLAVPDLPTNLYSFYQRAKHFIGRELDELICKHTFYNFYTKFLDPKKQNYIKAVMELGIAKGAIHMMSGIMANGVKEKSHFHYCPQCVLEDMKKYGETYWRLTHQLPGVYICTKHELYLERSTVPFRGFNKHVFVAATLENCPCRQSIEVKDSRTFIHLLQIARECEALALGGVDIDLVQLHSLYKFLLFEKGFVTVKGNVNQRKLAEQFQNYYGTEVLRLLQSEVNYHNPSCWLKAITRKPRKAFHPIRHILLINFLGETLQSISNSNIKANLPFGIGPYLCLNRASEHYGEAIIPKVEITFCQKTKRPIGTFRCKCGFHYSRKGPDTRREDKYKIDRIKQFGDIWIKKLHQLIRKDGLSYRAAARILGVDTKTVIKYSRVDNDLDKDKHYQTNSKKNELMKREWLMHIEDNSGLSITKLRELKPALYAWLYRHEKEWLLKVSPKHNRHKYRNLRVDWDKRDKEIADEIKEVVKYILKQEPPIRITVSRVGNMIKRRSLLEKHLDKLPRSKDILKQYIENIDDFQIRRIQYAVRHLKEKNEEIKEWKIRRIAGLRNNLSARVENFLEQVVKMRSN
ncbi:TnsD family transposase [Parageobacillus thermoglucosidasius]|uniref:TnsD family transposase n=1 Tax=Parageobacillus thermoglucosidasius TaxID=1426 RepID=UPI0027E7D321|nr:TnsD family Tn7-like transposition protein [Parageobacillus thermoglucosidasius]